MNGIRVFQVIFYHFLNLRDQEFLEHISSRTITSRTLDPSLAILTHLCMVGSSSMMVNSMVTSRHLRDNSWESESISFPWFESGTWDGTAKLRITTRAINADKSTLEKPSAESAFIWTRSGAFSE